MTSYEDLLAGLKDEPLQSIHRFNLLQTTSLDARTQSSLQKYQNLSRTDESDYSLRVMATGISPSSSRVQVHPLQSRSIDDTFDEFQAEVAKETKAIQQVKTMLSNSKSCSSVTEDDSLESLLVPDAQGRLQFGDPKKRHKRTIQALVTVSSLTEAIRKLEERTRDLSPSRTTEEIHEALCTVEDGSEILRHQLLSVTRPAISEELKQAREMLDALDQVTSTWRLEYPDSSPVKINNRKYFFDPGEGKNTPTIIAYCLALVSRVFERTAQRGASLILNDARRNS
ncbi:hypothetical protein F5879DRAFT_995775 [Lentinula edodes]|nr:hypothetical protein F5879DRAFT_995775 [Lentinula edodes]